MSSTAEDIQKRTIDQDTVDKVSEYIEIGKELAKKHFDKLINQDHYAILIAEMVQREDQWNV